MLVRMEDLWMDFPICLQGVLVQRIQAPSHQHCGRSLWAAAVTAHFKTSITGATALLPKGQFIQVPSCELCDIGWFQGQLGHHLKKRHFSEEELEARKRNRSDVRLKAATVAGRDLKAAAAAEEAAQKDA